MKTAARLIADFVGWTAGVFYELDRVGGEIPAGPVLVVANHPNSLLDPLIVFRVARRPVRPLAKGPLFQHPVIGPVLRILGGVPVWRRQDDPERMHENKEMFERAVEALQRGDAVQIYPEGRSHSEPALVPLRTGAARIALRAEAERGWQLGLQIVPVGLTYQRKTSFRGRAVVVVGEPFGLEGYRASYAADPAAAVRRLTEELAARLHAVTLNLPAAEDHDLVDTAERLYAREKGWAGWREREGLGERLPRLQRFAEGVAWLCTRDPARYQRLALRVRRYRRQLELMGSGEADIPRAYGIAPVAGYVAREGLGLLLLVVAALPGIAFWCLPYLFIRFLVERMRIDLEGVATHKLGASLIVMPLAYAGWIAVGAWAGGARLALAATLLLPLCGFAALAWLGRWERLREDAGLFFRTALRRGSRERFAAQRAELVAEFDAILEQLRDEPFTVSTR